MTLTDQSLLARLSEIGDYKIDSDGAEVSVEWKSPKGIPSSTIPYELCFTAELGGDANLAVSALTDTWDQMLGGLEAMLTQVETILVSGFREVYHDQLDDDELDDVRDVSGDITDKSILSAVESGTILLMAENDEGETHTSIILTHRVPWDVEHGMSIHIEDGEPVWGD